MLLRSMRKGFLSAIFLGFLVMGAVGLIFSDWNGMFKGGFNKTDVAKVDGTPIKISEFNNRLNQILRQQNIPAADAYKMGLVDNVLMGEIYEILIKKDAAKLGIRVADRIVAEQIKTLITPYKSATVSDKDALKKFLEVQGMSEKQLVAALRDDLTTKILKSTISSSAYVPQTLAADIQAYRSMTKDVEIVFLPNSAIEIKAKPSDKDLEAYYAERTQGYMLPESRDVTVAILDTSKIAKPTVTDADIKAAYDDNKDKFAVPKSANVEQSLLSDEAKAKQVADAVKGGKSMEDAVKATTGDTKSFQGKNSFAKDGLPSDIATPVFAAKSGDVIGPIKSALGFHVIKLIDMSEAKTASLDSVKDKIRKELEEEKAGNAVFDVTSQIEDRLANGEKYEDLTKEYPVSLTTLKSLKKDSKAQKEGSLSDKEFETVLAKAFAVKDSTPSELSDISSTKLYSVRADKITPAAARPFAEVKAEILKKWTDDNQAQENLIAAQKKVDDLTAGKVKFDDLKPNTVKALSRSGSSSVAKDVTARFMSAEKGKFIMAISQEKDGIYIGRVTTITLPKTAKADEKVLSDIQSDIANTGYMAYMDSLQNKYHVTINNALLARTYGKTEEAEQ